MVSMSVCIDSRRGLWYQCQLALTAGGGWGINDVMKVEKNVHVTCRTPGPGGSGGGDWLCSSDVSLGLGVSCC